jgi:catechol 2,3-dioxygenase-like lactoylglutathione lyase family enzyme
MSRVVTRCRGSSRDVAGRHVSRSNGNDFDGLRRYAVEMIEFNHAMIYSRDVGRALGFYRDLLGFTLLEEFRAGDRLVYARLKPPAGTGTIALHLLRPGEELKTGGVRLYFEIRQLEKFCERLEGAGAKFSKPPALMPWGWKHAYLDDPDGHEISLYWAGAKRLKKAKA